MFKREKKIYELRWCCFEALTHMCTHVHTRPSTYEFVCEPSVWNRISCRHKFNVRYDIFPDILQYVHKNHHKCSIVWYQPHWLLKRSNLKKREQEENTRTHLYNLSTLLKMQCFWKAKKGIRKYSCNAIESSSTKKQKKSQKRAKIIYIIV